MKKRLQLGFIGGGANSAIGLTHKIASQLDGDFTLVAGCFSRNPEQNRHTGESWNIHPERIYESIQAFILQERHHLDAVAVLTPTPDHHEIITACFENGLAVICEKAMVESHQSALHIMNSEHQHQAKLFVTYNYSGYPMVRELQKRVQRGDFGAIQQVMVEMPQEGFARHNQHGDVPKPQRWRQQDAVIPTVSLDLGVHVHQLIEFITGDYAVDIYAINDTYAKIPGVIDTVHILSRYQSGMTCNYWYGKAALGYRNGLRIRVMGSQGSAEWLQMDPEFLYVSGLQGSRSVIDRTANDNIVAADARYCRFKAGHPAGFIEAFANYYADIASALRGEPNDYVMGSDVAARGLHFLESAAKSATSQQKCTL